MQVGNYKQQCVCVYVYISKNIYLFILYKTLKTEFFIGVRELYVLVHIETRAHGLPLKTDQNGAFETALFIIFS